MGSVLCAYGATARQVWLHVHGHWTVVIQKITATSSITVYSVERVLQRDLF